MKMIKKIKIIFIIVLLTQIGYSQQLVQNVNELYKIKEDESLYRNRQLKKLLGDIKPEIQTFHIYNTSCTFAFCFQFAVTEQESKDGKIFKDSVTLLVYVDGPIPLNGRENHKESYYKWTKDDLEQYSDFRASRVEIVPECPY